MDEEDIKVFTNEDIIGGGDIVEIVTQDRYDEEIIRIRKEKK